MTSHTKMQRNKQHCTQYDIAVNAPCQQSLPEGRYAAGTNHAIVRLQGLIEQAI